MPFNSLEFLFVFLPATLLGFLALGRLAGRRMALGWLLLASVVFYVYTSSVGLAILLPSILLDYWIAQRILHLRNGPQRRLEGALFAAGIVANIAFLGYFKYRNFFLGTANDLFGAHFALITLLVPLGISFITFQKIAFLADVYAGKVEAVRFFDFLLFTLFFPRAIAGPIVHYQEMVPQFERVPVRFDPANVAIAVGLFSMGLFKKTVIADHVADFADPVFNGTVAVSFLSGWIAAFAYTFQIYFDFSGYSDMALAFARLFGIRLPMNFNSPLRARSIVEFWTNWHMTLTRFLTDYIYTPLVLHWTRKRIGQGKPVLRGKRSGPVAIAVLIAFPTIVTMGISGLWHGVGFTFIVWGLLHGVMLTINQAWRILRRRFWTDEASYEKVMKPAGLTITFFSVVAAMVFFRANSIRSALAILGGMVGLDGISIPHGLADRLGALGALLPRLGVTLDWTTSSQFIGGFLWIFVLTFIVFKLPNSLELLARYQPALDFPDPMDEGRTRPRIEISAAPSLRKRLARLRLAGVELTRTSAIAAALLAVIAIIAIGREAKFIYWKF